MTVSDPSLQNDSFALKIIREFVKRKIPKQKMAGIADQ
ncbi:MAG: hypothetical protein ACI845_000287 [Gammaproteobacteria bacterium]|jgi:hypothetical protein